MQGRIDEINQKIQTTKTKIRTTGNTGVLVEILTDLETDKQALEKQKTELEQRAANPVSDTAEIVIGYIHASAIKWTKELDYTNSREPKPDERIKLQQAIRQLVAKINVQISVKTRLERTANIEIILRNGQSRKFSVGFKRGQGKKKTA
jgi:hypothetical protein